MLKKIFAVLIALSLFSATLQLGYAQGEDCVIYVSKNGSAGGDGSENNPLDSIVSAQQKVRELIKENNKRNITVCIREGVYDTLNLLDFGEEDSVADNYTLTYKSYEDENVVFVSGIKIDSTKAQLLEDKELLKRLPNEGKGKVWVYDIGISGLTRAEYGEIEYRGPDSAYGPIAEKRNKNGYSSILSYNGVRMTVAKYPNSGYLHVDKIIKECPKSYNSEEDFNKGITIPYPDMRCDRWVTAKDAIIFGTLYYDWGASSADLGFVDKRKCQISSKQGFLYGIRTYSPTTEGGKYYVYNLFEEIDAPGEYYIDRDENKLYFYPMDNNPKEADITIGYRDYAIFGKNAKNITFENLNIEGAKSSAVRFENSENILLNGCQIKNSNAAVVYSGGYNCGVVNSIIRDVNGGISLGGTVEQRDFLDAAGHYAINNHIYNWGIVEHRYASAATMSGVGNIFAKNKVHGAEHQAIQPNGINNVVEYNEFFDTNKEVGDSGCLYEGQNYAKRGNVYRYNYFHDIGPGDNSKVVNCVYLDDTQSGTKVYGNIFKNASNAVFFNHGMDNKVFNNIFINCNSTYRWNYASWNVDPSLPGGKFYNNTMSIAKDNEIWRTVFPEFFTIEFNNPDFFIYVRGNEGYDNVAINTNDAVFSENTIKNTLVNSSAEPALHIAEGSAGFVDYTNGNYALRPNSPIYEAFPDFKYDFENIGYEEDGLSLEKIEEYKSHRIKIDSSLDPVREKLKNERYEDMIFVLKGNAIEYYKQGEYKLYSNSEAISPIYIDGRLMLPAKCAKAIGINVKENEDLVSVTYDGNACECSFEKINDDIAIPLRECFEKLGYNVVWTENRNVVIYNNSLSFDDEVIRRFAGKL